MEYTIRKYLEGKERDVLELQEIPLLPPPPPRFDYRAQWRQK